MKYLLISTLALLLTSCNEQKGQANREEVHGEYIEAHHAEDDNGDDNEGHSHEAPNGGILTELGEHSANLEWLLEEGQLKIYIFDGCATDPIRITQEAIQVSLQGDEEKQLTLAPVTNKLTGEKPGDSNTFYTDVPGLDKEKISGITVYSVTIKGINYKNINLRVR